MSNASRIKSRLKLVINRKEPVMPQEQNTMAPGRSTSEWKAWIMAVLGSLAIGLGTFLTFGLVKDTPGFGAYEALVLIATTLASVTGVTLPTLGYNKGRVALKIEHVKSPKANPTNPA